MERDIRNQDEVLLSRLNKEHNFLVQELLDNEKEIFRLTKKLTGISLDDFHFVVFKNKNFKS